jgi:hypothetical protein
MIVMEQRNGGSGLANGAAQKTPRGSCVLQDGQMRASNMPFNSNLGDAHVASDLGASVAGSAGKEDSPRPRVHRVQQGGELIQTLLAIEDLIRSRALGYQRVLSIDVVELHFAALY